MQEPTTASPPAPTDPDRLLSEMHAGESGRLLTILEGSEVDRHEMDMLSALGFAPDRSFLLCKAGNPCIIQVGSTRIGISEAVARHLRVSIEG